MKTGVTVFGKAVTVAVLFTTPFGITSVCPICRPSFSKKGFALNNAASVTLYFFWIPNKVSFGATSCVTFLETTVELVTVLD